MATVFRFVVEDLGYAECRVDSAPVRWHTGLFSELLPALICFLAVAGIRWYSWTPWWWLPPLAAKALLSLVSCWKYLHWLNPLHYESVAAKRTKGVELCTRWWQFERSIIIPFRDLVAVTIQEVSDRRLLLTFQARGITHQAFKQHEPDIISIISIYGSIASLLPRQVKKGRVLSLMRDPSRSWAVTRWAIKEWDFLAAFCLMVWDQSLATARSTWYWCLRRFYSLRNSEWWEAWAGLWGPAWGLCRTACTWVGAALRRALAAAAAAAGAALGWAVTLSRERLSGGLGGFTGGSRGGRGAGGSAARGSSDGGGGASGSGVGSGGGSRGEGGGPKRPKSRNKGRKH